MMKKMDKERFYKFFSNQTSIDEERELLDWLELDPAHYTELLAERKLYDRIMLLSDEKALAATPKRTLIPLWTRQMLRYAAVILLVVGAGIYSASRVRNEFQLATNTVSVPAGQHINVVLSDGTKVCVNALSTLEYPACFAGDSRQVKLTGEAFFEVTHDRKKPFVVNTFACNVKVLGTKFDVLAHPERKEFTTSLVEGSVQLTDARDPQQTFMLKPNQQAHYEGERWVVNAIPQHEEFRWREGLITFSDVTFAKLVGEFERYYGVRIELRRAEVPTNLFTGKIRISEGVDHALWVLQQSCKFTYARNEANNTIYIQ